MLALAANAMASNPKPTSMESLSQYAGPMVGQTVDSDLMRTVNEFRWEHRLNKYIVRSTHPDGSVSFAETDTVPAGAREQHFAYSCALMDPYEVIFNPRSWIDAIKYFERNGVPRVAITTTFYFDSANDFRLFVLEYNGTTWPEVQNIIYGTAANRNGMDVGNMDNDVLGLPDIVVGHENGITVFLDDGTAAGHYLRQNVVVGDAADVVALYDVDGDGNLDVISIPWQNTIDVRYGDGTGRFPRSEQVSDTHDGFNDMVLGDVDGDNIPELNTMSGQGRGPTFTVRRLQPGLPLMGSYTIPNGDLASSIVVLNTPGSGPKGIFLARSSNTPNWLYWYELRGGSIIEPPLEILTDDTPEVLLVGDMTCDSADDLIAGHPGAATVGGYKNLGSTLDIEDLCNSGRESHWNPRGQSYGKMNGRGNVFIADQIDGGLRHKSTCCLLGAPPDTLFAVKAANRRDIEFTWLPSGVSRARVQWVDSKTDIPTLRLPVQVCAGPAPCVGVNQLVGGDPTSFYVPTGDCQ